MAMLAHQRTERRVSTERDSPRPTLGEQPQVCVDCVVCGSSRSRIICSAAEIAAQHHYLSTFYRRRWRAQNAATAADRVAFTQNYATDVVRCLDCGLLYRNPRPRPDSITSAYRQDRYDERYLRAEFANQRAWARRKLPALAHYLNGSPAMSASPGHRPRVLEVGSFVGGLLAEGQARGWDMFGVDPGEEVTAFCRARGLPVFQGTLEEAKLNPGSFDAVVVWNTFDQLPDPHPTLEAAIRLLRDGGVLTVRIPNGACFSWAMEILPELPRWLRRPLYVALAWNNLLTFPYVYGYSADTVGALTASYGFRRIACLPDTLMPAPAGHTKLWATMEAWCSGWVWRASWQVVSSGRFPCAPWLDLYFERAASDERKAREAATDPGLGLIPVYAPLTLRQTYWNRCRHEEGG